MRYVYNATFGGLDSLRDRTTGVAYTYDNLRRLADTSLLSRDGAREGKQ